MEIKATKAQSFTKKKVDVQLFVLLRVLEPLTPYFSFFEYQISFVPNL